MIVTMMIVMGTQTVLFGQVIAVSSVCTWKGNYLSLQPNGMGICSPCSECPAGKFLRTRCTKNVDTKCARCRHGYFSPGGFKKRCIKCRRPVCKKGFRYIGCKRYRNAACVPCKKNHFYLQSTNECKKCSICPPGHYVSSPCGLFDDTLCKPCPKGTFLETSNLQLYCSTCTFCRLGEQTIRECTADHNTKCGSCSQGYFRLESSYECAKCSVCYRGYPEYTIEVEECRRRDNNSDSICMPVAYPPFGYENDEEYEYELITTKEMSVPWPEDVNAVLIIVYAMIGALVAILIGFTISVGLVCIKRQRRKKEKETRQLLTVAPNNKVEEWVTKYNDNEAVVMIASNSEPVLVSHYSDKPYRHSYPTASSLANNTETGPLSSIQLNTSSESEEFNEISVSKDDLRSANINEVAPHVTDEIVSADPTEDCTTMSESDLIFTIENSYNSVAEGPNIPTTDTGYCSHGTAIDTSTTADIVLENVTLGERLYWVKEPVQATNNSMTGNKQISASQHNTSGDGFAFYQSTCVSMQSEPIAIKENSASMLQRKTAVSVHSSTPRELKDNPITATSQQVSLFICNTSGDLIDLGSDIGGASTIYSRNQNDSELEDFNGSTEIPAIRRTPQASRHSSVSRRANRDDRCQQRKCHSMDSACYEDNSLQTTDPGVLYYSDSHVDSYLDQPLCADTFVKNMKDQHFSCKCTNCSVIQSL